MNQENKYPDTEVEQLRRAVQADTPEDEARDRLQGLFNRR